MELVPLSLRNVWEIVHLRVTQEQDERDFVASNGCSVIESFAAREDGHAPCLSVCTRMAGRSAF